MTNIITFGEIPDNLDPYTRLQKVIDKERFESERAKLQESEPVDKSLLIEQVSGVNKTSHVVSTSHVNITSDVKSTPHVKSTSHVNITSPEPGKASIVGNYRRRDDDVKNLMPTMSGNEWKVYCYFLTITYEFFPSKNICSTTHPTIQQKTGIASNKTVGIAVDSLIARGFLKRILTARRANEKSMYRVFLPCEFNGYTGKTKIMSQVDDENG
jgi:hypothetical protein